MNDTEGLNKIHELMSAEIGEGVVYIEDVGKDPNSEEARQYWRTIGQ